MFGKKAWGNVSFKSTETRAAIEAIEKAFSDEGLFTLTKELVVLKNPSQGKIPDKLCAAASQADSEAFSTFVGSWSDADFQSNNSALNGFNGRYLANQLGHEIVHLLSADEYFRYGIAYQSLKPQSKSPGNEINTAFIKQVKNKILKDSLKEVKTILKDNPSKLPTATLELAKSMLDSILHESNDDQIVDLRHLKKFLGTDWAKGVLPSVHTNSPQVFHKNMRDYEEHKPLLDKFKKQLSHYNSKIEIQRAYDEIKTEFLTPANEDEFNKLKRTAHNAFVWFNNQLHHVNSDGTMRRLPTDLQQVIWGSTPYEVPNTGDMSAAIEMVSPPITLEQQKKLDSNKFYLIHYASTNTYRVGYKDNGSYREKALNTLLGDDVPFDPAVVLAQQTLKKVKEGTSLLGDYRRAVMAQLPRTGKYFSMVHQGKWISLPEYAFVPLATRPEKLEKNTIYLYTDEQNNVRYAIITPNNERVYDQKLEGISSGNLVDIDKNSALQSQVLNQIHKNGHAYKAYHKRMLPYLSDPNSVWSRYWTKPGHKELTHNWREKSTRSYAIRMAAIKDQFSSEFSESRQEALNMVSLMSKGDLSVNQHICTPDCGIAAYSTGNRQVEDLITDEDFKKYCLNEDFSPYMYYLHDTSSGAKGLYFVDKSNGTAVITKVTVVKRLVEFLPSALTGINPEENTIEKLYQDIDTMLKTVKSPIDMSFSEETWVKLGIDNATEGVLISPGTMSEPNDASQQEEFLKYVKSIVQGRHRLVLTTKTVGSETEYNLHFPSSQGPVSIMLKSNKNDANNHLWLIKIWQQLDNGQQPVISEKELKDLNALLRDHRGFQLPNRTPAIAKMSDSLRREIEARTNKMHVPVDVYDNRREKYMHIEVSNRLSYVVEQRRELWRRYPTLRFDTFKEQLKAQGFTIIDTLPTAPAVLKDKEIYLDPNTLALTMLVNSDGPQTLLVRQTFNTHQDAFNAGAIGTTLTEPDDAALRKLNRSILAESYVSEPKELDEDDYKCLRDWYEGGLVGEAPIKLSKNEFYLYKNKDDKWLCLGIDHDGKFFHTHNPLASKPSIDEILQETEQAGVTLKPVLIPDTEDVPFLRNCEEVQRLFFAKEDSRPSKGLFNLDYFSLGKQDLLNLDYFPMEKRVELMEMMIEVAKDPKSPKAMHYLRENHTMYITQGKPTAPNNDDDGSSFYLDIQDPNNPTVYRFVRNQKGESIAEEMKLNNFLWTTPAKRLYRLAKKHNQGQELTVGEGIPISCRDVYYNITRQSNEGFKTGTAREVYEEVRQAEIGWAKILEALLLASLAILMGALPFFLGGTLAALGLGMFSTVGMAVAAGIATFFCTKAAILKNAWLDGGLASFEATLDSLNITKLKEKVSSFEKMFEVDSGLTGERFTTANQAGNIPAFENDDGVSVLSEAGSDVQSLSSSGDEGDDDAEEEDDDASYTSCNNGTP